MPLSDFRLTSWQRLGQHWSIYFGLLPIIATYITSFFLPAAQVQTPFGLATCYGWEAFRRYGPWFVPEQKVSLVELFQIRTLWFANPLLWSGVIFLILGAWRWAALMGCLAVMAALMIVLDLENVSIDFRHLTEGYYCWLGSTVLLTCVSLLRVFRAPRVIAPIIAPEIVVSKSTAIRTYDSPPPPTR
jgi:hypothetical protein